MTTTVLDETDLMLDLLREAGDEAVTLDELHVVGVQDPAAALLALELAGHSVHRVYEQPSVTCVRLGAPEPAPVAEPIPFPRPVPAPAPGPAMPPAARDHRSLLLLVVGALLVLLVTRRGR